MGKVFISGIVPQKTAPITFKSNFADNDWSTIIKACQTNKVPDTWKVGDQKAMTINGTDYLIDIIGKNHDTYSDGSGKAPLTFQMHDCYVTSYPMHGNNSGNYEGWESCDMRLVTLPSLFALLPTSVQNGIRAVSKVTHYYNGTTVTTSDTLFLLGYHEVCGNAASPYNIGTQYEYYTKETQHIKYYPNGNAAYWWTRTKYNDSYICWMFTTSGWGNAENYTYQNRGVSFAFCF